MGLRAQEHAIAVLAHVAIEMAKPMLAKACRIDIYRSYAGQIFDLDQPAFRRTSHLSVPALRLCIAAFTSLDALLDVLRVDDLRAAMRSSYRRRTP